jgi:hypothetical protein
MRNLESHLAVNSKARSESDTRTLWHRLPLLSRTPALAMVAFFLGVTSNLPTTRSMFVSKINDYGFGAAANTTAFCASSTYTFSRPPAIVKD